LYITDFQLFNKSVVPGEDSPINKNISFVNEIILSSDQNIFSFRFSALDYNSPQSIQYIYELEGVDKDWIFSGKRRYAAYTNLSPGTYYFRVKSTNSDGLWVNNIRSVKVIINSPWWKTGWAFAMYLVIIVIGLIAIRRFELNRTRLRHELKMREFEAHKFREIENIKSRFFANLSHEFRTPLMLIKGPIEQLRSSNIKSDTKKIYDIIYRNTEKLHLLIDQLLELSQLEAESIPLKARKENLVTQLKGIFYSFRSIAEQKNILIEFESVQETICAWIDRDKLEKIITNILSNAFKFTPEGGMITLLVKANKIGDEEFALVKISDTGIGIPKEKLSRIFDRFFQVDDSSGRAFGGSGIGLSLVKELVDLHKWKIELESEVSRGTSFIISIPLSDNYLSDHQKVLDESSNHLKDDNNKQNEIIDEESSYTKTADNLTNYFRSELELTTITSEKSKTIPTMLIVEDSEDIREYIKSLLLKDYKIVEAENGETGLKVASETEPDIIISDIMMPGMDGMEFCKKIKTDLATSHIPVILLTAKVSQESKIEGFETGADDYVTKPFSSKELIVRIKNLLKQRQTLKEKFSKEIVFQPDEVTVNYLDKEFLEKALAIAEKNILEQDFDLDKFAKKMFLSRSQLYRKLVAITGQPPGEFLRIFKLKKAANLILERKLSITQIALEVGFNSPSHFTKAFQQYFNCLPSEFIEKSRFTITKK
jgi:signal transduction histidine kinase/DNA-binding response OmpR family regulator